MSHEFHKGAFRRPAWHKLGETFSDPHNIDVCAGEGSMVHTIDKVPAYQVLPGLDADGLPSMVPVVVDGQFHLRRSDSLSVVSPCTVSNRYSVLQPSEIVDTLRPFVEQGWATVDGMFSLYEGGSDVICLQLDSQMSVTGDESDYQSYLVVQNFHGRGCARAKLVTFRVVCHNTSSAAFNTGGRGRGSADFALRHTGDVAGRLNFAVRTWDTVRERITDMAQTLGLFANFECVVPDTIQNILGVDKDSSTRQKNRVDLLVDYARASVNDTGANALTVFNAFTGWASHDEGGKAGKTVTGRIESQLDGDRGKVEQRAVDHLIQLVS